MLLTTVLNYYKKYCHESLGANLFTVDCLRASSIAKNINEPPT